MLSPVTVRRSSALVEGDRNAPCRDAQVADDHLADVTSATEDPDLHAPRRRRPDRRSRSERRGMRCMPGRCARRWSPGTGSRSPSRASPRISGWTRPTRAPWIVSVSVSLPGRGAGTARPARSPAGPGAAAWRRSRRPSSPAGSRSPLTCWMAGSCCRKRRKGCLPPGMSGGSSGRWATACRRGGALALRRADLDPDQCLVLLQEKGETVRWQPDSPTLMGRPDPARPGPARTGRRAAAALRRWAADHVPPLRPPVGPDRPTATVGADPADQHPLDKAHHP